MSLVQRIQDDLAANGLAPLHRFGQNFMIDERALTALVELAEAGPGVRCAEVGPGTGVLTERLLAAGATVLAVEIDAGLHRLLAAKLVPLGLHLVHGDALDGKQTLHPALVAFAVEPWRLVSNLPYDVALPVILNAMALPNPPARIAVTVQREAAQRLVSRPGDPAWGATACIAQAAGTPTLVRRLGPGSFFPPPRVDSAILGWSPKQPLPAGFSGFVRAAFAYRRKVLLGALRDAGCFAGAATAEVRAAVDSACRTARLDPARRLEDLGADEMLALHAALTAAHAWAGP